MKLIKSFVLAFILLTVISSNNAFSQTVNTNQPGNTNKALTVKVKGITCSNDLKLIAINVKKLKGVNSCKTVKKGTTSTFDVAYNPALVTEKQIYTAIENTGSCDNPNERPFKVKQ